MIETTKSFVARAGDSLLRSGTLPAPTPRRVLLALAWFVVALALTVLLRSWLPYTRFMLFHAAIIAGTLTAGLAAGGVMTVASLAVLHFLPLAGGDPAGGPLVMLMRNLVIGGIALGSAYLVATLQGSVARAHGRRLDAGVELAAARRAVDRARQLQELSSRLLDTAGEAAVQRKVALEVRAAVGARAAAVVLPDANGDLAVGGWDGPADVRAFAEATFCGTPMGLEVLRGEEVAYGVDAGVTPAPGAGGGLYWVALPLRGQRGPVAVLALGFDEPLGRHPDQREFLEMAAQHGAQALERAYLYDSGLRGRIRAEFAERRLAFLAEASARLASSLDYESTLAALAHMCVPDLADWCLVHLEDAGRPRLVAVAHADETRATAWRTVEESSVAGAAATIPFARILETGEPELIAPVPDDLLQSAAADDGQLATLRSFGLTAMLVVPIGVDDRSVGSLTFVLGDSGRSFDDLDSTLAVELGRRAGQAVENARLYATAHNASEAKSDFLAVMSHELRTPLNAIIGYSDLLLMGVPHALADKPRSQVERIRSASNSLLELVEEVLSFSRIEAGKEELRISPVSITGMLQELAALVEPMAAEKALAVTLDLPTDEIRLVSDERKIRQIITNLLSNAIKFTEEGGITIEASLTDREVLISVRDTGIGIPSEHLERVFEPFWQVEDASTRRFGGTGLGLGVARKLAILMEGRLDVESELGQGSVFTLTLPRHTPGMHRA